MVGGCCTCAFLDRPTSSFAPENLPSPLFPLDTKKQGVPPSKDLSLVRSIVPFRNFLLSGLLSTLPLLLRVATDTTPLFRSSLAASPRELLFSANPNHSRTSKRLARNPNYSRTYAKHRGWGGGASLPALASPRKPGNVPNDYYYCTYSNYVGAPTFCRVSVLSPSEPPLLWRKLGGDSLPSRTLYAL